MIRKIALLLLFALFSFSVASFADEQLAVHVNEMRVPQIIGIVKNHKGEPVAGVRVVVIRRETGHIRGDAKTDEQGRFAFPDLKEMKYNIKVYHGNTVELYHVKVTNENASPELVLKYK